MEPKNNLAILTGDRLNESIFTSKCMAVLPGGQNKVAEITRWPYYRARGGTRYILAWGGAARPLIPWPCLRQISLIFHTLAGRTSPLSPYKGVSPPLVTEVAVRWGFTVLLFLLKLASLSLYKVCWQMVSPIVILLWLFWWWDIKMSHHKKCPGFGHGQVTVLGNVLLNDSINK